MSDDLRSFLRDERRKLVNYVRSFVSETASMEAEDIVQDVLIKLIEKRQDLPPLEQLGAYTFRAVRNRAIDKRRSERPNQSFDEEDLTLVDVVNSAGSEPFGFLQSEQDRNRLFAALDTLKDIEREVIISHELENIPFSELSEILGISQNTLLSHKSRGLKKLTRYFSNEIGESK